MTPVNERLLSGRVPEVEAALARLGDAERPALARALVELAEDGKRTVLERVGAGTRARAARRSAHRDARAAHAAGAGRSFPARPAPRAGGGGGARVRPAALVAREGMPAAGARARPLRDRALPRHATGVGGLPRAQRRRRAAARLEGARPERGTREPSGARRLARGDAGLLRLALARDGLGATGSPPRPNGRRPRAARPGARIRGATPSTRAARTPARPASATTTPVGVFPGGASPYGALDMAGNVEECTGSLYRLYPGSPVEDPEEGSYVVTRGGCFALDGDLARCDRRHGAPVRAGRRLPPGAQPGERRVDSGGDAMNEAQLRALTFSHRAARLAMAGVATGLFEEIADTPRTPGEVASALRPGAARRERPARSARGARRDRARRRRLRGDVRRPRRVLREGRGLAPPHRPARSLAHWPLDAARGVARERAPARRPQRRPLLHAPRRARALLPEPGAGDGRDHARRGARAGRAARAAGLRARARPRRRHGPVRARDRATRIPTRRWCSSTSRP